MEEVIDDGDLIDDRSTLTLGELCELCGVHAEYVLELVEHGVIEPAEGGRAGWCFTGRAVVRSQRALRLQHDLGLNLPGVSLALELLDEVERLRVAVERLSRRSR